MPGRHRARPPSEDASGSAPVALIDVVARRGGKPVAPTAPPAGPAGEEKPRPDRPRRRAGRLRRAAPPEDPDDAAAAEQVALRLLARANHSRVLLHAKLVRRGFSEAAAATAGARAEQAGYLDDRAFAEALVRRRTTQSRWGRALVARELSAKGIDDDEIARALGSVDETAGDERARALALARARVRGASPTTYDALVARVGPYLQRRGYAASVIRSVCRAVWAEQHSQ